MDEDSKIFRTYTYYPIYRYDVDGQEYRVISRAEHQKEEDIKVGSEVVLFVDAKDPRRFYCPDEDENHVFNALCWGAMGCIFVLIPYLGWIGALVVGLVLLVLFYLCYLFLSRRRKK